MSEQTQEQKDILEIKDDIKSIRKHLDFIKEKQQIEDVSRTTQNAKLDLIVNALVDNDFNGKNGIITRVNTMETKVNAHDFYWRVLFGVVSGGAFILALIKIFYKFFA